MKEKEEFAINNTVNRATGETPSKLLYGGQCEQIIDVLRQFLEKRNEPDVRDLERMRSAVSNKIVKTNEYNETYVKQKRKKDL